MAPKCILKIMRNDCPDWFIKAQIEAIEHLNYKDPSLKVAKILKSSKGAFFYLMRLTGLAMSV